jgi:hypothetical protein
MQIKLYTLLCIYVPHSYTFHIGSAQTKFAEAVVAARIVRLACSRRIVVPVACVV